MPEEDHPEGAMRDMVMDAHGYPGDGKVVGQIPQVKHTYRYFKSRYSFMNEMGVVITLAGTVSCTIAAAFSAGILTALWGQL